MMLKNFLRTISGIVFVQCTFISASAFVYIGSFISVQLGVGVEQEAWARPLPDIPKEVAVERIKTLAHPPLTGDVITELVDEDDLCNSYNVYFQVQDPSTQKIRKVQTFLMAPSNLEPSRRVPALIIVPTIEGRLGLLEDREAEKFCEEGIISMIADFRNSMMPKEMPGLEHENQNFHWVIQALRTSLDYLQSRPDVNPKRLGMIGFSLGGIVTSLVAGVEDRLAATYIGAAGGNLSAILAYSDVKRIVELRRARSEILGLKTSEGEVDQVAYEDKMREHILYDPLYFAFNAKKDSMHMMVVIGDTSVPRENQNELWEKFRRPGRTLMDGPHVPAILSMVYLAFDSVMDFFTDELIAGVHAR